MNLQDYQDDINQREFITQLHENIMEQFELIISLAQIKHLCFYKYNYEYNEFMYDFTMNSHGEKIEQEQSSEKKI